MAATTVDSIWTSPIMTAIIATGLVSAVASWGVDFIKILYGGKKAARYGAMRCATELERYALGCWHEFIMGQGEFRQHQNISGRLPPAPEFPQDVDWKALALIWPTMCFRFPMTPRSENPSQLMRTYGNKIRSITMQQPRSAAWRR